MDRYVRATSRNDLSDVLLHLTAGNYDQANSRWLGPFDVVKNIVYTGLVWPSTQEHMTRYEPRGAACFYDVPFQTWEQLVDTNPNGRRGCGLIVLKRYAWMLGCRPVIYTDYPDNPGWPENERYRLVRTDLVHPTPRDWMHEREWRSRGGLGLAGGTETWWWPCVETEAEASQLLQDCPLVHTVYMLRLRKTLFRPSATAAR